MHYVRTDIILYLETCYDVIVNTLSFNLTLVRESSVLIIIVHVSLGSVQNMDSGLWTGLMDWTVD